MTERPKRLLALDGGGLMGLISLGILCRMEDQLRAAHGGQDSFRLRDHFDYIAGTSTGAIIAAALMLGRSAQEITQFYLRDGPAMFAHATPWQRIRSGGAFKFQRGNLAKILKREFSESSILDLQTSGRLPVDKHLLVVMRNASTDSCWPISTNPTAKYNNTAHRHCNRLIPLWQLVRASTAAPFFFRPEEVTFQNGSGFTFVDGGLTPHNNPALKLFQMATMPQYNLGWPTGADRMLLVSVGTGTSRDPIPYLDRRGINIGALALRTPADLMRGASTEIDITCRMLGQCRYGAQIDRELGDLVVAGPPRPDRLFTYVRYNADISISGLQHLGLDPPCAPLKMDQVRQIRLFQQIGKKAADQVAVTQHFQLAAPPI